MNAAAIIIIAIAASGVLMMRFRKRWLAKINIVVTNRITGLFAGWLPGFEVRSPDPRRTKVRQGLPHTDQRLSRIERLHHRAHIQQPVRMGEERSRGRRM